MEKIRVVIADDHPIYLIGLKAMLAQYDDIEIIGTAADGKEACEVVEEQKPDVILLDIIMPVMNGIEATRHIRKSGSGTKIVILSSETSITSINLLLEAGINGFISKNADVKETVCSIRSVFNGIPFFGTDIITIVERIRNAKKSKDEFFTPRELDIIRLSCEGLMSKEIGDRLGVARKTVENVKAGIFSKLGVNTTTEIVRYAFAKGLISM